MRKDHLFQDTVKLRKEGYSYSYIQKQTGVSKSTLSDWLSKLPYKPNKETLDKIVRARLMANQAQRDKKIDSLRRAHEIALKDIGKFTKRDLFILGIGIYIGEGSKTTNSIRITNSDQQIIKTSIAWFKKCFHLQNNNFSIRIHLYPDTNQGKALDFWSKETGLPKSSFLKTVIDTRTDKKRKNKGKLPYGTAHLSIKGGGDKNLGSLFSRRILSLIEIVHKNAGVV